MKKIWILCLMAFISTPVIAIDEELRKTVSDISAELALINQQIVDIYQVQKNTAVSLQSESSSSDTFASLVQVGYETIIKSVRSLEAKYKDNPYIRISGFNINVGVLPSVTVSMEFKK